MESVIATLRQRVRELCLDAELRYRVEDRHVPGGAIGTRIRRMAREADASMTFVGSENAGHLVTSVSSVGGSVAAEDTFDVVIVRHRSPTRVEALGEASPHRCDRSEFYSQCHPSAEEGARK